MDGITPWIIPKGGLVKLWDNKCDIHVSCNSDHITYLRKKTESKSHIKRNTQLSEIKRDFFKKTRGLVLNLPLLAFG